MSWNILKLTQWPALERAQENQNKTDDMRRVALSMAVLTQVRIGQQRYSLAKAELGFAEESLRVDQRLLTFAQAAAKTSLIRNSKSFVPKRGPCLRVPAIRLVFQCPGGLGPWLQFVGLDILPGAIGVTMCRLWRKRWKTPCRFGERMLSRAQVPQLSVDPGSAAVERQIMAKMMMQRYFVSVGLLPFWLASAHAQVAPTPTATDPNAIRVLLSPELETTLVSQMVGRIATLNAQLGGPVSKGVIVGFDCGEASAKVRMAQAEYDSARETLETSSGCASSTQRAMSRYRSPMPLPSGRGQRLASISPRRRNAVSLPRFSGRVVRIHVKPHQGVAVGAPLVELVSDGPLKLRLNVPSRLLRTLKIGQRFDVDIDETGKTYPAKVTAINAGSMPWRRPSNLRPASMAALRSSWPA